MATDASAQGASSSSSKPKQSESEFVNAFADRIARRDYVAALALCRERLKDLPQDRCAADLRATVEQFVDATDELEAEDDGNDLLPPQFEELEERCSSSLDRGVEALYAFLNETPDRLWKLGEQAVSMFWDIGQVTPPGPRRDRLFEISSDLTRRLLVSLRNAYKDESEGALSTTEWLLEALGLHWWFLELGLEVDGWLLEKCREELLATNGSMEVLVGFSPAKLSEAHLSDLCDILTQTWTIERCLVCSLLWETAPPQSFNLEYGVARVFSEIRNRPLVEPPLVGFFDCFYVMTHVAYVMTAFNGHLPGYRSDCPWLFSYLERSLTFWLREVKDTKNLTVSPAVASKLWSADAVDAVAEAADCLLALGEPVDNGPTGEAIRGGIAWLLDCQQESGLFFSPGQIIDPDDEYNYVHPTWTAITALQIDRKQVPSGSPRCEAWVKFLRGVVQEVNFAEPPPAPPPREIPDEELSFLELVAANKVDEGEEDEDDDDDEDEDDDEEEEEENPISPSQGDVNATAAQKSTSREASNPRPPKPKAGVGTAQGRSGSWRPGGNNTAPAAPAAAGSAGGGRGRSSSRGRK